MSTGICLREILQEMLMVWVTEINFKIKYLTGAKELSILLKKNG